MEMKGVSQSTLVSVQYSDDEKHKVASRKVIIFFVIVVAAFVGLCIGLYFIGKSDGFNEANQSNNRPATTAAPVSTTTASSAETPTPNLGYRLPRNAVPIKYRLTLYPDIYQKSPANFTFRGWEIITIRIVYSTDRIFIHAAPNLEIDFANLKLFEYLPEDEEPLPFRGDPEPTQATNITFIKPIYHSQFAYYELVFSKALPLGEYKLRLSWSSKLVRDFSALNGLYYSSFTDSLGTSYMAVTQFQATAARKAFPCFDEPEYKAIFETRLVRKTTHRTLSNAEKDSRLNQVLIDRDALFVDAYEPTVVMSSYLNAFAVHQYTPTIRFSGRRILRFWHREDRQHTTEYIANITSKILEAFDRTYKTDYPFKKLDFIPIPDFSAGAMENWGLVTFAESSYYYDPEKDPHSQKEGVAAITAHELGHMNFGNFVTTKWWDDLWLNEGFASYLEYAGLKALDRQWDTEGRFLISDVLSSMRVDCLNTTRPISKPVESPSEISSMFDSITYSKGASLCRMMEAFLSPTVFEKGLTAYQRVFKLQSVVFKNLYDAISGDLLTNNAISPPDINTVMEGWTTQPGHPVVYAEYNGTVLGRNVRFSLLQEPFELEKGKFNYRTWHIPMTPHLSGSANPASLDWFIESNATISVTAPTTNWYENGGWFVLNVKHNGYYRINYDLENWQRVTRALLSNITAQNAAANDLTRTQLIDDAFYLALGGYPVVTYHVVLNLAKYLCHEFAYAPWRASLDGINLVEQHFWQTEYDDEMKAYGRKLIYNVYKKIGWIPTDTEVTSNHYLRNGIMARACRWRLRECFNEAKVYFDLWLKNPSTYLIPKDTTSTVRCYGIKASNSNTNSEWWSLYNLYIKSSVQADRNNYINALGCSDNEGLMKWFLENALTNSTVRSGELLTTYQAVAANTIMHNLVKTFFYDNWKTFNSTSSNTMRRAMEAAFQYVNTQEELNEVQQWKQKAGNLGGAETNYNNLIVTINKNIAWMNANQAVVVNWLTNFNPVRDLPEDCQSNA